MTLQAINQAVEIMNKTLRELYAIKDLSNDALANVLMNFAINEVNQVREDNATQDQIDELKDRVEKLENRSRIL